MDVRKLVKFVIVLLIAFGAQATNIDGGVLALIGASGSYPTAAALSVAVALLVLERNAALVALVLFLCFMANMPDEFVADLGVSRELIIATLIGVVLTPFLARLFKEA